FTASSLELSSGGMSLKSREEIASNQAVEVSFALMTLPRISLKGNVSWRNRADNTFGVRFDVQDPRRLKIKAWIDSYFEN
ncbi:MAG: PilZ domain-containing protein, partial [Acidobacteriaceae bacterium]